MNSIATCKHRLPLPLLLVRLGLFERPPGQGNHRCPLHQERNGAAFGINFKHDSWVWNCHGKCSTGGDELTLLQHHYGLSIQNAIKRYADICELPHHSVPHAYRRNMSPLNVHQPSEPMPKLTLPPDLRTGSFDDCNTVARLRKVPTETTIAMSKAGLMGFASVAGFDS